MPAESDDPSRWPKTSRRRWRVRLSVGGAMILVAAVALGLGVWEHSRRVRVSISNRSGETLLNLVIGIGDQTVRLGSIPDRSVAEAWIKPSGAEMLRLDYQLASRGGQPTFDRIALSALQPGSVIKVSYDSQKFWMQYKVIRP